MASKLILYSMDISPPCRFVLMTLQSLNLKSKIIEIDLFKGENKSEEFTKMNPKQQVPVLVDGDLTITDSHAACVYLMNKFGSNNCQLYPKTLEKRAMVDQILCFNMTHFFPANSAAMGWFFKTGKKLMPHDELWMKVENCYRLTDKFIEKSPWLAGSEMTLADLCCLATITSSELLVPLDEQKYIYTTEWLKRCKETPQHLENNQPGVRNLENRISNMNV